MTDLFHKALTKLMRASKKAKSADAVDEGDAEPPDPPVCYGRNELLTIMDVGYGESRLNTIAGLAAKHKISRGSVRMMLSAAGLALLKAQQETLVRMVDQIQQLIMEGGRLVRAVEMVRWDETSQTMVINSDLLAGERSLT